MQVIFHIGLAKTGTTAIQNFLLRNTRALNRKGIAYPLAGRIRENHSAHHAISWAFLEDVPHTLPEPHYSAQYNFDEYSALIKGEMHAIGAHTAIISSENFGVPQVSISHLRKIQDNWPEANVVILMYFRRQSDMALSHYAQRARTFRRLRIGPRELLRSSSGEPYGLNNKVKHFEEVFGADNVFVHWYEDVRHDLLEPFRQIIGFDMDNGWVKPELDNRRLSWPVIRTVRWTDHLPVVGRPLRRALLALERRTPDRIRSRLDEAFRPFSQAELRAYQARFDEANTLLKKRTNAPPPSAKSYASIHDFTDVK